MNTLEAPRKTTSIWPYAIIMVYVLFALYIGYMVKQAMSTTIDLVSKDYYQKEIAYQQHMNTVSRTAQLSEAVSLQYSPATSEVTITLPQEFQGQQVEGSIHFFRPSDLKLDFQVPVQLNEQMQQHLSTSKLQPGYWRVLLNFTVNGQPYYTEQRITVAK